MTRLTGRELVEHITYWADAYAKEGGHALVVSLLRDYARAIEAELSKQEPVARPRLPRIDHFAREAFEKFASGVECELTNYRWFEAGWDARGDTVAAAPLPSAPAQSITDYMMDLVDRLGHEAENVDPKAWQHLLVYAPKPSAPDTVQVPDPKPRWFDI